MWRKLSIVLSWKIIDFFDLFFVVVFANFIVFLLCVFFFFLWQVQVQSIPAASFIAFRRVVAAPVVAPELGLLDRASLALTNVFRREPSPPPQAQVKIKIHYVHSHFFVKRALT
jgi:hypothetical protein